MYPLLRFLKNQSALTSLLLLFRKKSRLLRPHTRPIETRTPGLRGATNFLRVIARIRGGSKLGKLSFLVSTADRRHYPVAP